MRKSRKTFCSIADPQKCLIISNLYPELLKYLSRRFPSLDFDSRKDISHDTWINFLDSAPHNVVELEAASFVWLITTASRITYRREKRQHNHCSLDSSSENEIQSGIDRTSGNSLMSEESDQRDMLLSLEAAFHKLPKDCKEPILLFSHGFSQEEIARKLSLSRKTINQRISKAISLLRVILTKDYPE